MRTVKGCPHGKGSFAVQDNTAHDIVTVHDRDVHLCRALALPFAVRLFFAVRSVATLPYVARCRMFCGAVVVRHFVAVHDSVIPRQRNLCRATAHGRVE
jgi:hypothetical protein